MKKLLAVLFLIVFTAGLFFVAKKSPTFVNADTGAPVTITATYNSSTGQLDTSGSYAWIECEPGEQTNILGFAVFINGGTPADNNSNALDGAGMHLANSGNPCEVTPDNWADNSHVLSSAPTNVCVVVYDVRADDSADPGGTHSTIGAGADYNIDNSWNANGNSYPKGSCTEPTIITPTPECEEGDCTTPTPTSTPTPTQTLNVGGPGAGDGGSDGLGCASRDCSGNPAPQQTVLGASTVQKQGQVLGASTFAKTGAFDSTLATLEQMFGLFISSVGMLVYGKKKKSQKRE